MGRRRLRGNGECFTCEYIATAGGDPKYASKRHRVNRRKRTTELIVASRELWQARSCPLCLGGDGPICRPHLLAGSGSVDRALGRSLAELAGRLDAFSHAFVWRAPPATEEQRSSWVEALGWFAGWTFPPRVAAEAR